MSVSKKHRLGDLSINADSLIDILTSVVGFMVILVLFTVIAGRGKMVARNVNVTIVSPVLQKPTSAIQKQLIICQNGRASLLPFDEVIVDALDTINRSGGSRSGISSFNSKNVNNHFFVSTLKGFATPDSLIKRADSNLVILHVERKREGESIDQVKKPKSLLMEVIRTNIKAGTWVHFIVDEESLDIFLYLRAAVRAQHALIGWEPIRMPFPLDEALNGPDGNSSFELMRGFQVTK